jgi:hypothetical protein
MKRLHPLATDMMMYWEKAEDNSLVTGDKKALDHVLDLVFACLI